MSQGKTNLEDLLKEESITEERLDELNLGKFFKSIGSTIKNWTKAIQSKLEGLLGGKIQGKIQSIGYKRFRKRSHLFYTQKAPKGRVYGFLYPSVVKDAVSGAPKISTSQTTFAKLYAKGTNVRDPKHAVLVFDRKFITNSKKSNSVIQSSKNESIDFFSKLSSEIIDEAAPRGRGFLRRNTSSGDQERISNMGFKAASRSTDMPIPSDDDMISDPELEEYLSTARIGPEAISDILSEFITSIAFREKGDDVPSLLIQGFPGGGKTSIIKAFAKARFQVHVLEVASIYKEVLGGFPTVQNNFEMPTEEIDKNVSDIKAGKEVTRVERDPETGKQKKVVMTAADIFPEEDGKIHVFFLDEYNRDAEKMAASMNLLLSGSIGNQYELPRRTIVVAAGNLGEDIDKVSVQRLDNATFDRFSSATMMKRDVVGGEEFTDRDTDYTEKGIEKAKPDEKFDIQIPYVDPDEQREFAKNDEYGLKMGGAISSMDMFVSKMAEKYGVELMGKGWDKELAIKPLESEYQTDDDESDETDVYLLTPRKLDRINKRLKDRVVRDWIEAKKGIGELVDPSEITASFPQAGKKYKDLQTPEDWEKVWEEGKQNFISRGLPSPAALYMHVTQWHYHYLPTIFKQVLGGNPGRMINTIRKSVQEVMRESNQITPNDIIFGYAPKRALYGHTIKTGEKVRDLDKDQFLDAVKMMTTVPDNVMRQLVDVLAENASEAKLKQQIEKSTDKSFDDIVSDLAEKGVKIKNAKALIAMNIHLFIKGIELGVDRVATLVHRMKEYGFDLGENQEVEETEAEVNVSKTAKELVGYVYGMLVKKNEIFKESRLIKAGADLDELDKEDEEEKNEAIRSFFEKGFNSLFENMR